MKKAMNARLEWKGRKLMCNGVCVAWIFPIREMGWSWNAYMRPSQMEYTDKPGAKAAASRHFKLKD